MCLLNFQNYFRNVPKTNAIITCRMVPLFHLISRGLPGSIRMESVKWLSIGPINQVSSKISLFIGCIFVRIVFFLSFAILSSPERFDQSEYISEHSWLYLITVLTNQTLISLIIQSGNKDYSTKWLLCCRHTVYM